MEQFEVKSSLIRKMESSSSISKVKNNLLLSFSIIQFEVRRKFGIEDVEY